MAVKVEFNSESLAIDSPAKVCVYEGSSLVVTVISEVVEQEGADGRLYPCVELKLL